MKPAVTEPVPMTPERLEAILAGLTYITLPGYRRGAVMDHGDLYDLVAYVRQLEGRLARHEQAATDLERAMMRTIEGLLVELERTRETT
jgi:hypothetical protein